MLSVLFVVNDTDSGYMYCLQSKISPVLLLLYMPFYMSLITRYKNSQSLGNNE